MKHNRYYFQVKEFLIIGEVFDFIVVFITFFFRLNVRPCSNHHNTLSLNMTTQADADT